MPRPTGTAEERYADVELNQNTTALRLRFLVIDRTHLVGKLPKLYRLNRKDKLHATLAEIEVIKAEIAYLVERSKEWSS